MYRIVVAAVGLLLVPGLASAVPGERPNVNGPQGPRVERPERPQPPARPGLGKEPACVIDCREELRACVDAARTASEPCFTACQELVEAAHTACAAGRGSEECRAAVTAARECLKPCREALAPEVRACVDASKTCIGDCPEISDPECVEDCRDARGECVATAHRDARSCGLACSTEAQAVREACRGGRRGPLDPALCREAREALQTCLTPCQEALRTSIQGCGAAFEDCATLCSGGTTDTSTP